MWASTFAAKKVSGPVSAEGGAVRDSSPLKENIMAQKNKHQVRKRRKQGLRKRIKGTSERPRLSVFRSAKHIYAQLIDDTAGVTLGAASSQKLSVDGDKTATSLEVGKAIAAAAKDAGITKVVFDRNGFIYHGRVAAVAKGARDAGLEF